MSEFTLQSVISGKKEIVAAHRDGDTVVAVITKLLERYEATREQCEVEVRSFLNIVREIKQYLPY
jgi:hypothetical protein